MVATRGRQGGRVILEIQGFNLRGGGDFDSADVAWIEVSSTDEIHALPSGRLFPGERPSAKSVAVVVGAPEERIRSQRDDREIAPFHIERTVTWIVQMLGWATNLVAIGDWPADIPSRYSPEFSRLLEYGEVIDVETGRPLGHLDPHGMSGGGIWMLPVGADSESLWIPSQAVLAGIQTGYIPSRKVLCGNSLRPWIELMRIDHPELRPDLPEG